MKLNATATTILAVLALAADVALTAAHIAVPTTLAYVVAGLVGGHLALQVPGGGTVTLTTTPTAEVQTLAAALPTVTAVVKAVDPAPVAVVVTPPIVPQPPAAA